MNRRIVRCIICLMLYAAAAEAADGDGETAVNAAAAPDSALIGNPVVNSAPDTSKTPDIVPVSPTVGRARVLLVDGTFNIESLEADIAEGDYDDGDEQPSLLLGNDAPTGFGFIIPGGVLTTMGGLLLWISIVSRSDFNTPDDYNPNDYNSLITISSCLAAGGVASFTFGMFQHRLYVRMDERYALHDMRRTTPSPTKVAAPVVIRKTRQ